MKKQAEAAAKEAQAAAAAAKPTAKGKTPDRPASRTSNKSRPQTGVSTQSNIKQKLEEAKNASADDKPRDWNFTHFDRVTSEMTPGATSVGSLLAAMVY